MDWQDLQAQLVPKQQAPRGKVDAEVIGRDLANTCSFQTEEITKVYLAALTEANAHGLVEMVKAIAKTYERRGGFRK